MTTPASAASVEAQNFNWLVARFAQETAGVIAAIAVSSDGLLVAMSAGLERASEHPLAAAVVQGAEARGLAPAEVRDFASFTGKGVVGAVAGGVSRTAKVASHPGRNTVSKSGMRRRDVFARIVINVAAEHHAAGLR